MSEPLLLTRHLGKTYQPGTQRIDALRDINLTVQRGEFIVMLGPSGSGKSTLLNILGGLHRPSEGSASFAGHDLSTASDDELTRYRREHVGFVFQFYNLIPSLTARENVELVTDIADHPMDAAEALAMVGLTDRLDGRRRGRLLERAWRRFRRRGGAGTRRTDRRRHCWVGRPGHGRWSGRV